MYGISQIEIMSLVALVPYGKYYRTRFYWSCVTQVVLTRVLKYSLMVYKHAVSVKWDMIYILSG